MKYCLGVKMERKKFVLFYFVFSLFIFNRFDLLKKIKMKLKKNNKSINFFK